MKKLLVLFVCLFVTAVSTQAQSYTVFFTGNRLVEQMREYDKYEQGSSKFIVYGHAMFCGYITGVCDAMHAKLPDGTIIGQVVAIVAKYLKEHPELWAKAADDLVRQAIIEAFGLTK